MQDDLSYIARVWAQRSLRAFHLGRRVGWRWLRFARRWIGQFVQQIRRSFRAKLLALLMTAIVIPTSIAGIYLGYRLTGQINKAFSEQLDSELRTFGLLLNTEWEELRSVLVRISNDNTVQKNILFETGFIQRYLNEQRRVSQLDWLYLYQAKVPNVISGRMDSAVAQKIASQSAQTILQSNGKSYLTNSVPIVAEQDTLAWLAGGINLNTDSSAVQTLFQQSEDIPVVWWNRQPIVLGSRIDDLPLTEPGQYGFREDVTIRNQAFVGMSERVGVGGHSLILSVYRQVDTYQATIRSSIVAISITLLVIMALFMYIGLSMVNTIARPLRALTDYTRTLVADTIQPRAGERVRRIRQQSTDEVGELANAFETMQVRLDQYIQDLKQATEEQERLNSELRIARDIQMNMLPGADQRAAFEPEFQVAADIRPARQVGGDLYDLFPIGDHQYALVIGDVADKGIPAALFMAMSKTLVRAVSMLEYQRTGGEVQPHRILKQIAGELRRNNEMFMFVTLFLGIVDTRINSLKYTSAGHPPAMLIRQGNHPEWLSQEHGVPLGIQAAPDYTEQTISFEPGDTLILYTDGILEAENASGGFFGEERMMQAMKRARQDEMNPESIRRNLVEQVTGFAGGYEQSDDQTLLIIQRDGTEEFSSSQNDNKIHIEVGENNGEVRKVLDVLEEFSALHTLPEEAEHDLSLILEEYIANLTKYGFLREQNPWLQVSMKQQGQAIQLEIQDNGQPFDLNQSPMEELKQRSAAEHPGEHGLLIIRSLAASVDYNRKTDHNECVIRYRYQ